MTIKICTDMRAFIAAALLASMLAGTATAQRVDHQTLQTPPTHEAMLAPPAGASGQLQNICIATEYISEPSAATYQHFFLFTNSADQSSVALDVASASVKVRSATQQGSPPQSSRAIDTQWNTVIETLRAAARAHATIYYRNGIVTLVTIYWNWRCS